MAVIVVYGSINTDQLQFSNLMFGMMTTRTSSKTVVDYADGTQDVFFGSGITYGADGLFVSGTIIEYERMNNGTVVFDISGVNIDVSNLARDIKNSDNQGALNLFLSGDDTFIGGPNSDTFRAGAGNDTVRGAGGNDVLDGGAGTNTLVLSGKLADYTITHQNYGPYTVVDNRTGSPDGTDTVSNFQYVRYADGGMPFESSVGYVIFNDYVSVLRTNPLAGYNTASFTFEVERVEFNSLTPAQATNEVVLLADSTTSVATMSYQFFTGSTPTPAGLDYLVNPGSTNPTNLNSAYYAQFSTTNRYINFAVNLGRLGEGAAAFQIGYGSLSLADATSKAYAAIFGATPTSDKVSHLLNDLVPDGSGGAYARLNYFAYYGGDGPSGLGTKAAMVGWLIAQADSAHIGTLETANISYLLDLAAGRITGSVDLVGTYHGTPYTGG